MLQFGGARPPDAPDPGAEPALKACPDCGHEFTGDAQFCPFDGTRLGSSRPVDPTGDPLVGTVVDSRYEVERVLGEGGMGTVYRVRHRALGRQFALKALKQVFARDSELSARFIQEAKAAASVSHPNVVQITDFGTLPSGQPYFMMELLEGESLSRIIKRGGPLPAARAVRILRQVAEALSAAHAAGVVHRDLKPDNIQVGDAQGSGNEIVKVLDFGLAKVAGASKLTRAGMVFGTPHYMSPEQASGDPVDHRSDIYALGVVMYEVFTGRVPFEADSYMGVLTKHMYMAPTPPSEIVHDTRELGALEDITLRCLQKKPDARYPTMADLLVDLERIVNFTETGDVSVRPSQVGAAPRPRNVLADQLEPPSAEEMRAALMRAGVPTRGGRSPGIVFAVVGAFALLAAVGFAWIRLSGERPAEPVAAPPPAGAPAPVVTAPSKTPSEPVVKPIAGEPPAAEPPPAATGIQKPAPAPKRLAPARGPARPRKPKKTPKIGGGEIVNPWSD